MSGISPLRGRDAWVRDLQTRGLSAQTAAKIADTSSQENTGERVNNGEIVEEGGVLVDLTDGLSQEEATALGLKTERTADRYIRQGWAADGEAGVETEEQGVNVTETDELERAYAAIARYADAHGITYEQAQRIYFESTGFSRQDLREQRDERIATRDAYRAKYETWKQTHSDGTFIQWAQEEFNLGDADPVLLNLKAYIESEFAAGRTHAVPELIAYLQLNFLASQFQGDRQSIQTDANTTEGNYGLALANAIPLRANIYRGDYAEAPTTAFLRNDQPAAADEPAGTEEPAEESETQQADAVPPPAESPPPAETTASASPTETPVAEAPTGAMIYSEQVPSDILGPDETTTAEQLLLVYPLSNDEISAQSREGETALQTLARSYPGVSGWTAVLTETDNSIQGYLPANREGMRIVSLAYELAALSATSEPVVEEDILGFSIEIGEDGQEVWVFDADTPAVQATVEPAVQTEPPVVASTQERIVDFDNGRDIPFNVTPTAPEVAAAAPEAPVVPVEPPVVAFTPERIIDFEDGRDIPFNIQPTTLVVDEPTPDNPVDITHQVAALRDNPPLPPATQVLSPEPEIVPEPTVEPAPAIVAEAAPPPPATPRQTAGESLASLIENNDYNLISITSLLPGPENYSLRGVLTSANNQLRNLGQGNPLKDQFRAEYIKLLSQLSAVLQTPDTADEQAVEEALNDLNNIYYSFESAEMAAARGDYEGAITAYEGLENRPAFLTARLEELKGLRDTAVAQQTQLADLRTQAHQVYDEFMIYVREHGLTDQDLNNNLAWLEAQVGRLESMQDPAEIQKFIDSLPGARTLAEGVVARRDERRSAESTDSSGVQGDPPPPPPARGRLGDIPINLNDRQIQNGWNSIFGNFTIAQDLARLTQQDVTLTGYFCFNPATGEIAFSSIVSEPYLYGSDGDKLTEGLRRARQDLRFNPNPNFPAGVYEADPGRGEGWYRVQIELHGENPYR